MELPHFTLFWRRLLRKSGSGQIRIALFWLVASTLALFPSRESFPYMGQSELKQYTVFLLILVGHFLVYRVIASTMQLAVDETKGGAIGWFSTLVGTPEALLGTLLATVLLSAMPYVGLCLFQIFALAESRLDDFPFQVVPGIFEFGQHILVMVPGLVSFALACVALQLPFRNSRYSFLLPDVIAAAAACIAFWECSSVYGSITRYTYNPVPFAPTISLAIIIAFGLFLILRLAVLRPTPGRLSVAAFSFFFLPVVLGVFGGTASVLGRWHMWYGNIGTVYLDELSPLHAALSTVYPGLRIAWDFGRGEGNPALLLGTETPHALAILVFFKLLLCFLWWKFAIWQINTSRRGGQC